MIKLAQLDIGFARSRTDVAVVEMQGGYTRAHVTRFTALYTSLSTPYNVELSDTGAIVQPFAVGEDFSLEIGVTPPTVNFHREKNVKMTGYHVLSNRTGLVHSEQIAEMGGAIELTEGDDGRPRVNNGTTVGLEDAILVRAAGEGQYQLAWIGDVGAIQGASGEYEPVKPDGFDSYWQKRSQLAAADDVLDLTPLVRVALSGSEMAAGDVRLVAISRDNPVEGLTVSPSATQSRSAALVLVHLRYGADEPPVPDRNCHQEFDKKPLSVSGQREPPEGE